jgi:hypothetical protein
MLKTIKKVLLFNLFYMWVGCWRKR